MIRCYTRDVDYGTVAASEEFRAALGRMQWHGALILGKAVCESTQVTIRRADKSIHDQTREKKDKFERTWYQFERLWLYTSRGATCSLISIGTIRKSILERDFAKKVAFEPLKTNELHCTSELILTTASRYREAPQFVHAVRGV